MEKSTIIIEIDKRIVGFRQAAARAIMVGDWIEVALLQAKVEALEGIRAKII